MKIALDGPAGAGKSTVAKSVAKELNILYLDTGAMYRSVALYMDRKGILPTEIEKCEEALKEIELDVVYLNGSQHIMLSGEDVSDKIRENRISQLASAFSALPCVRKYLVKMQREVAQKQDCILDGRDIGTCVLPDAEFKFFLTAASCERARRRCAELEAKGQKVDFETLKQEIEKRDYDDSHRAVSPLKQAEDAILVDSTDMNIEQTVNFVIGKIKEGK